MIDNVNFEDGTELEFQVVNDNTDEARRQLEAELRESFADVEAGRTYSAAEVLAELRARQ